MSTTLANYQRDAFIDSVMNDVPKTDYRAQMFDIILNHYVAKLPDSVRRVYENKDTRYYINLGAINIKRQAFMVPAMDDNPIVPDSLVDQVQPLINAQATQTDTRKELRAQIKSVVYGCKTYKQLRDKLPEFEKYIPKKDEPPKNELVVANVVTMFMQAGWPKDGQGETLQHPDL